MELIVILAIMALTLAIAGRDSISDTMRGFSRKLK